MSAEYEHDIPAADHDATAYIKTKCVGGPWHGANITHLPTDTEPRHVDMADKPGRYEHDVNQFDENFWRWVPESV